MAIEFSITCIHTVKICINQLFVVNMIEKALFSRAVSPDGGVISVLFNTTDFQKFQPIPLNLSSNCFFA